MKAIVSLMFFISTISSAVYADGPCLKGGLKLKIFDGFVMIPGGFYLHGENVFRDRKIAFHTDSNTPSCASAQIIYETDPDRVKNLAASVDGKSIKRAKNICNLHVFEITLPPHLSRGIIMNTTVLVKGDELLHISSISGAYQDYVINTYCTSVSGE